MRSEAMDDSFRVRVDKVFGSLAPSSASSLKSSWSLSDEEVEKREWNRERGSPDREENPSSSSFDGFFTRKEKISENKSRNLGKELENDLEDPSDDDDGDDEQGHGSSRQSFNRDGDEKDEWEIRSSIGLDCTLDNEEEEDEYDKVALGRENAGDRMYMKDITDYGPYLNSHNVLPDSFQDHTRDPRANYFAARIRLKEDETAGSFDSFPASVNTMPTVVDPQVIEDGGNLKSILKRKESRTDSKSQKRVRFDPGCKDYCDKEEEAQDSVMVASSMLETTVSEGTSSFPQDAHGVPDYIRNPSKYTRYSFDSSSEVDEESNRRAYMDFLNMMKKSDTEVSQLEGSSADLPKSVTFTPKKKVGDATAMKNNYEMKQNQEDSSKESVRRAGFPMGIAALEAKENEPCAMEEDEPEATTADRSGSTRKPGRQYRLKVRSHDSTS